ncbi:hypothetical protein PpBr36_08753 [Pyricularia pennisetigena]|uniref:hypothetical protein n=1 Tax=Pyricularia pennisetigena TaxID=1578925 RepID=UPI00114D8645|nr:hypothetical protein PpBr36_08753 [Pyricularia pennisetigena]TLS24507.1 hypothetical protein PpBr36_08753 [Pyricularia pennisetigena]
MCIVVLTTAHPDYALIVINNRDEYILRPTSRPHWWTPSPQPKDTTRQNQNQDQQQQQQQQQPASPPQILSSRDLNRPERGTWLGITRTGNFACLTNYSEADPDDARHSVHGVRSRGAIVSAWLAADPAERTPDFVHRILSGSGVKGVGGFSLVCGKLRRRRRRHPLQRNHSPQRGARSPPPPALDPLAIISNRSEHPEHVPYIASRPSETHGLSNTVFDAPGPPWPKVSRGCDLLNRAVASAVSASLTQDQLVASLFSVLSTDDLPRLGNDAAAFEAYQPLLRTSVFIPPLGRDESWLETRDFGPADRDAAIAAPHPTHPQQQQHQQQPLRQQQPSPPLEPAETLPRSASSTPRSESKAPAFTTGMYGTQRQTVILVDWEGSVRYTERALWDDFGNPLAPGEGDVTFRFQIEGWNGEDDDGDAEVGSDNMGNDEQACC